MQHKWKAHENFWLVPLKSTPPWGPFSHNPPAFMLLDQVVDCSEVPGEEPTLPADHAVLSTADPDATGVTLSAATPSPLRPHKVPSPLSARGGVPRGKRRVVAATVAP